MLKTLLLAFITFSVIGCVDKEYVYLEAQCPTIEQFERTTSVDINATEQIIDERIEFCISVHKKDGTICGESAKEIFSWMKESQTGIQYYFDAIKKYNEQFSEDMAE